MVETHTGALIVAAQLFFNSRRDQLMALAARHAIPTIYSLREAVVAGGLISYGPSVSWMYRLAGIYSGEILKGKKPTDLRVQQPTNSSLSSI